MKQTIFETGQSITDIKSDMVPDVEMKLFQQEDGDVVLTLTDQNTSITAEFCTFSGGGQHPVIAKKLRELIVELANECSSGG